MATHHRDSRLAPRALLVAAWASSRAGDEAGAQETLVKLIADYPDAAEVPEALYLLGHDGRRTRAARVSGGSLSRAYPARPGRPPTPRPPRTVCPRSPERVSASPRCRAQQRLDRADRLLRGGVPQAAADEADRLAADAQDVSIAVRALKLAADASQRLGRYDAAVRAIESAVARAPVEQRSALQLEQARLLQPER